MEISVEEGAFRYNATTRTPQTPGRHNGLHATAPGRVNFGSLFSGVGGFDLGLERAGMKCRWQVEFDSQAQSVLRRHWPDVDLHKDVCDVGNRSLTPVDLICGGFPCQDVSVAGKRAGLAGERSGLWWEFHRIIGELAPTWVLIENVPGLLSSNEGRDMAVVVHGLEELGYGWSYRILDSQYFGVAQRRRRVFIVGHLGGFCAPEILLEPESLFGDTGPSREAGTGITPGASHSLKASGGNQQGDHETYVATAPSGPGAAVSVFRKAQKAHDPDDCERWEHAEHANTIGGHGTTTSEVVLAADFYNGTVNDGPAATLGANSGSSANHAGPGVLAAVPRRLTPTECERLQGFPDNWSRYADDGKELTDGPRYRMMGNAVTVNVAEWIGHQIAKIR